MHLPVPQRLPALLLPLPSRSSQYSRTLIYSIPSGVWALSAIRIPASSSGERLLQARRRYSRHPAGRSGSQRRCSQNSGEFPGSHGEEEDKERRVRPEGTGPRGTGRSWGRPGRRGRRPQRRLGQVRLATGHGGLEALGFLDCSEKAGEV